MGHSACCQISLVIAHETQNMDVNKEGSWKIIGGDVIKNEIFFNLFILRLNSLNSEILS